jgi:hypothetical protein
VVGSADGGSADAELEAQALTDLDGDEPLDDLDEDADSR